MICILKRDRILISIVHLVFRYIERSMSDARELLPALSSVRARRFREDSFRIIIFPIRSEVRPLSSPFAPPHATPPRYMHPSVPALALNRAPSHHRLACIPTPKAGGWHVAHYVICPLDQSTGGAHFFPASKKKGGKGERDRGAQESARGGQAEKRRTRVGKRRQR